MNTLRCPLGTCPRCDEIDRRERDAACVSNPAPITSFTSDADAVTRLVARPESILALGVITGAALNDWHRHGEPFWPTFGAWAASCFLALCIVAALAHLAAWRDRWFARRRT